MPLPNIGLPELIIILVIALLVIGPGKLPEVGSALGKSIREFRKAAGEVQEAASLDAPAPQPAPAKPAPAQPAAISQSTTPVAATPVAAPSAGAPPSSPAEPPAPNVLSGAAVPNEIAEPKA